MKFPEVVTFCPEPIPVIVNVISDVARLISLGHSIVIFEPVYITLTVVKVNI